MCTAAVSTEEFNILRDIRITVARAYVFLSLAACCLFERASTSCGLLALDDACGSNFVIA